MNMTRATFERERWTIKLEKFFSKCIKKRSVIPFVLLSLICIMHQFLNLILKRNALGYFEVYYFCFFNDKIK